MEMIKRWIEWNFPGLCFSVRNIHRTKFTVNTSKGLILVFAFSPFLLSMKMNGQEERFNSLMVRENVNLAYCSRHERRYSKIVFEYSAR